ncbi:MAG: PRC-barrel domain-containing protein [Candidatus Gracilibacteria bacterium]|jgi:sporulation protein YlmC with PRC-barrel domain
MERYYNQTIGADVLTETGIRVGKVFEIVIEPTTGKIVGFLITPRGDKVIAPSDVIFWGEQLVISDHDDIMDTEDLIKVQQALKLNIRIHKNKVFTKKNEFLGTVLDFALNTSFFMMTKLFVAKTFLGFLPYQEKVIAHKNILEITYDKIIVKNPIGLIPIKDKEKAKLRIDIAPTG